jgi:hypothetical protein
MKHSCIFWTLFWVVLIGGFAYAIWYDETVIQPVKQAEREAMPATERYLLTPVCLNGVEYWMNPSAHSRSWMLTPKYSPGNTAPDICDAL